MLALDTKQQSSHFYPQTSSYPSHPLSSPLFHSQLAALNGLPFTTASPSPSDFNGRAPSSYFQQTSPGIVSSSSAAVSPASATSNYMAGNYHLSHHSNPAIRVDGATPTPAYPLSAGAYQTPNTASGTSADFALWSAFGQANPNPPQVATAAPTLQASAISRRRQSSHHRAASNASSNGSSSPFGQTHTTSYPHVPDSATSINAAPKVTQSFAMDASRAFSSQHLPTPTQTPTQDSFIAETYPPYNNPPTLLDSATITSMAMNRSSIDHSAVDEDMPGMSHSGRHSVSSMGQEPSTPHTVAGDAFDDGFKVPSHDNIVHHRQMHSKLDRTMSDVYQDELYNLSIPAAPLSSIPKSMQSTYLSPFRNRVTEALQVADFARSQSPLSQSSTRGVSPFRPDSPYVRDSGDRRMRSQAVAQSPVEKITMSHQSSPQQNSSRPTTISPKDAVLEYRPEEEESTIANVPLFSDSGAQDYAQQLAQQNFGAQARFPVAQNFGNFATSGNRGSGWGADQSRAHAAPFSAGAQQHQFTFSTPTTTSFPAQGIPIPAQHFRTTAVRQHEETPDFPAHLTSMESSASEAPPSSSAASNGVKHEMQHSEANITSAPQKPAGHATLADSGTYTCTYHGCNLRFETPQKLQKHKREGHRQITAQQQHTPGVGSGMTSAALATRNSQSGPHKCDRINPTTGKPCNTIFSRPYDLTRHEDTIHNIRKQKVRCALCVEEKTFSRNDALTRHMRVVHPDIDFPGKHRRRGTTE